MSVRFVLLHAGILTAALFAFANDQAHAVPEFRDGWVDQGGKYHAFNPGGSSGDAGSDTQNGAAGAGDSPTGGDDTGGGDTGLSGLNSVLNDPPLNDGPDGGGAGGTQNGDPAGSSINVHGSRIAVPEPASIALLGGALLVAGSARRRTRRK